MARRLLLALAALAATSGCSTKAPVVSFNVVCAVPTDAASCSYSNTCDAQYIGEVALDVGAGGDHILLPTEVHNQAADVSDNDTAIGRVNNHDAYLQQIDVEYSGGVSPTTTRLQQWIPVNGSAVVSIIPIPRGTTGLPAPAAGTSVTIMAKVKGKGIFGDGTSFETPDFELPIRICSGCTGALPVCTAPAVPIACPNAFQAPAKYGCST